MDSDQNSFFCKSMAMGNCGIHIRPTRRYPCGDTVVSFHTLMGARGCSRVVKTQSAKSWPNFYFRGRGYCRIVKTQSAKSWPNFYFQGRGYSRIVKLRTGILGKMSKNFAMPNSANPFIADSVWRQKIHIQILSILTSIKNSLTGSDDINSYSLNEYMHTEK